MASRKKTPKVGETYRDYAGRKLRVTEVDLDDPQGRIVRGKIKFPKRLTDKMSFIYTTMNGSTSVTYSHRKEYDYSTDLRIWQIYWRDKKEPTPLTQLTIG